MENLTLETLPKAFIEFTNEVNEKFRLLLEKSKYSQPEPETWFDLSGLCNYHPDKPSKQTVYQWCSAGIIPVHKSGKKLRFLKTEIDNWLKQGKKQTAADLVSKTDSYLSTKKPRC